MRRVERRMGRYCLVFNCLCRDWEGAELHTADSLQMRSILPQTSCLCIKRAHFLLMHSCKARPKARIEYMKKKCAHTGAPLLTCRSILKYWSYFTRTTC